MNSANKQRRLVILSVVIAGLMLSNVDASNGKKQVQYYVGCDNNEVKSDVYNSIKGVADYVKKNKISVIKVDSNKCGYALISNNKKQIINSALTDVDLMITCNKFFNIH